MEREAAAFPLVCSASQTPQFVNVLHCLEAALEKEKTDRLAIRGREMAEEPPPEGQLDLLAQAVEHSSDLMAMADCEGNFTFANQSLLRNLGLSQEETIGKHFSVVISEKNPATLLQELPVRMYEPGGWKGECLLRRQNGTDILVFLNAGPVKDKHDRLIGSFGIAQDITERKRMEQTNLEWQKRLELAEQAGLRIGLWDWDVAASTVIWSEETYRQFGYTREGFSGRVEDGVARIHPDDRPRIEAAIRGVLAGEREYATQYRIVRPDGTTSWIDAHGVVLRDGPTHMLGIGVDITDLKKTEESLQESEEKYLRLLNSTAEAIYGLDLQGKCTFCNPAGLRLLGYEVPEDLMGKDMHEMIHHTRADGAPYRRQECQIYVAIHEARPNHVTDELFWRADGTSFPVEYWSYPMLEAGSVVGSVVTFLDISERIRAERALRQSEEKYRGLFENASYGIYRSSADGRLQDVNAAMVSMLGYGCKEELMALDLNTDIYEKAADRASILKGYEVSPRVDREVNWKRKDGKTILVRLHGRSIRREDGSIGSYEVMIDDVTERRALEDQFRHAQKMEAVGRLSGGIAHDFNNLLSVIIGYSEVLLDRQGIDAQMRKECEEIKKAGDRAASLTRQLLAFSRQQVLEPSVLNLNTVVVETEKMLRRLIGEDVELHTSLDPALGSMKADPGQLVQVIMNLAVNARDAMPEGGKLVIETANADLGDEYAHQHPPFVAGRYVCLTVTDSGTGMNQETKARIFEPFFTTKEAGKGTGLGLSTVYGIVKQSGGYIWVYSEPAHGTAFKIYLPRIDASAKEIRPDELQPELFRGTETILLVEDEPSVRTLTRNLLEQSGYTVLAAENGAHAMEAGQRHAGPIHLLLTDVVMPGINGPALARELSSIHPETKVLYISGYSGSFGTQSGMIPAGAKLLPKPFSRTALLRKLQELLGPFRDES
jgi:two-component system, cell cycle sensor histidine kinase and response regulator CckA